MATISWTVDRMEVYPSFVGANNEILSNCVSYVYWTCYSSDTDSNGNTVTVSQTGYCYVPHDPEHPFIEYSALTQDEVLEWVWTYGSIKSAIEEIVNGKLIAAMNPIVTTPLPWF